MLNLDLSATKTQSFETIPAGKYLAACTKAELAETKSGGKMIKVELTIKNTEMEGRKIYTQFNIQNANPKAVEIGLSQMKTFMVMAGYANPDKLSNVTDLQGLVVGIKTKIKSDEEYGDKAEVSYFFEASKIKEEKSAEQLPF